MPKIMKPLFFIIQIMIYLSQVVYSWNNLESLKANCPTMFRASAGEVECHLDIDSRITSVVLYSDGLPDHWYDTSKMEPIPQSWVASFDLKPSSQNIVEYAASFKGGPKEIKSGDIIGFALNGVPFYKTTKQNNHDLELFSKFDGCLGSVDENNGAYYYILPSPCMFSLINDFSEAFDEDHYLTSFIALGFPSPIIGYALDGYPIYGPYDENGVPHTNLDSCNGKFDADSTNYGYYSTIHYPYLVNCFGPGDGANSYLNHYNNDGGDDDELLNTFETTQLACMDGYYRQDIDYDRNRLQNVVYNHDGIGQSPTMKSKCVACPAGRYGSSPTAGGKGGSSLTENCGHSCEVGFFCPKGSSYPLKCPAGSWGSSQGLEDSSCDGLCEAGYYCPEKSISSKPHPCGNVSYFCPIGSPRPIRVSVGFYTTSTGYEISDYYSLNHLKSESYHLDNQRKLSMLTPPTLRSLSSDTLHRTSQVLCEPGNYCVDGVRKACPEGTFGESSGLFTKACTGLCPLGHYCPEGSPLPIRCPAGTFGDREGLSTDACSGQCSPGYYCPAQSVRATQVACPAGRFGAQYGLTTSACSLNCDSRSSGYCVASICEKGYFCPPASTSPHQNVCGNSSLFCPQGSTIPTRVSVGHYTIGAMSLSGQYQTLNDEKVRFSQLLCEPGTYCIDGVKHACPAGTYGETSGLFTAECSGRCEFGYYCPVQSTSSRQRHCGGPDVFCPGGVGLPLEVDVGHYSIGITALRLLINNTLELSDYFMNLANEERGEWFVNEYNPKTTVHDFIEYEKNITVRNKLFQHRIFESRQGVGIRGVDITQMGSNINRIAQASCPPGTYCEGGVARFCPAGTYAFDYGNQNSMCSGLCGAGYYCPEGSIKRHEFICEAGRWSQEGSGSEKCSGFCEAGYYCPEGSKSSRQHECGGETYYCPAGSGAPLNVSIGYYSTGNTITTRTGQVSCKDSPPMGSNMTKLCPSTTAPLNGPDSWYDNVVDEYEYKRDVNDQGVDQ